jgi:hypothetical protein
MNRWILLLALLYSCAAAAQLGNFFQKKNERTIEGTPYCTHGEKLTIKEAPPGYSGKGEVSPDGFTAIIPNGSNQDVILAAVQAAYEQQKNGDCVVKELEELLKKNGRL